jgi:hypothetical protein
VIIVVAGLRWALRVPASGPGVFADLLQWVPLVAVATVVAAGLAGPYGVLERSAGSRLPWLRFGQIVGTTAVAAGGFALAGGSLRDLAGFVGITLLAGAVLGPTRCWIVPLGYVLACVGELDLGEQPWWAWPVRAAGDPVALVAALVLLAAGVALASRQT